MLEGAHEAPTKKEVRFLEDELEALKEELRRTVALGPAQSDDEKEILSAFAPRWIEHTAMTGKTRQHVVAKRLYHLETFILPFVGNFELKKLRRSDVVGWMEKVAVMRQPDGRLYNKNTLAGAWSTLRAMLKRAVILRDLDRDPTLGVKFDIGDHACGEARPTRKPKETVTLNELEAIIEASKSESPDVRAMIVVEVSTGMRFCELSALWWSDIDLDARRLHIERSQVEGKVGPPKTEVTRREVFLSPAVVQVLRQHKAWQEKNAVRGLEADLVFPSRTGGYRNPSMLRKPLKRACKLAGVDKHLSSHSLRKTTNNLLRQATSETVTRAMIGHATSEMTRLYSNVDQAEKARAHEKAFGRLFLESAQEKDAARGGTSAGGTAETPPRSDEGRWD